MVTMHYKITASLDLFVSTHKTLQEYLKERDDEEENIQGVENNDIQNQELLNTGSTTSMENTSTQQDEKSYDDSLIIPTYPNPGVGRVVIRCFNARYTSMI